MPGVETIISDAPTPRAARTDTGVLFAVGFAEKGKGEAVRSTSLAAFMRNHGGPINYGIGYDIADEFFHDGGGEMYFSRVLGPTPRVATRDLDDGSAVHSLNVNASSPGVWGNDLGIQVIAGTGSTKILVLYDQSGPTDIEIDRSPEISTQLDAVTWAASSEFIDITVGTSTNLPANTGSILSLANGTDDHTNATEANWLAALNQFVAELGPGQVAMPGRTTTAAHTNLLAHADANNRFALLDAPDTASVSTLTSTADAQRNAGAKVRRGMLLAPWIVIPGTAVATVRTLPPSIVAAALMARSDGAGNSANTPAAGANGESVVALDLTQSWSDRADRNSLNDAGVNIFRSIFGGVRLYGYRTLVDQLNDPNWIQANWSRFAMQIRARGEEILERYVFGLIDGAGINLGKMGGDLRGMITPYWPLSLFGPTARAAFSVDTGPSVNTDETIAAGEARAEVALRMSPNGETVILNLVKVPITEEIA